MVESFECEIASVESIARRERIIFRVATMQCSTDNRAIIFYACLSFVVCGALASVDLASQDDPFQ